MHSLTDTIFVFDLDDTLYSERLYELSGISATWKKLLEFYPNIGQNISLNDLLNDRKHWVELVFSVIKENNLINRESVLNMYRDHNPMIELYNDGLQLISFLVNNRANMAMITDGRTFTQRKKLHALQIEHCFNPICISEEIGSNKPDLKSYKIVEMMYPNYKYVYIGDNLKKDFVTPNKRGWYTYGLRDRGFNVHRQNIQLCDPDFQPLMWLDSLTELIPKLSKSKI